MADEAERQRRPFHSAASRWLREPLLHFLLLGAALFGGYSYFGPRMGGSEAAMQIRLTPDELLQLILVFQAQWQRPPTQAEFSRLVENKVHLGLDGLIVVAADEATEVGRAVKRDGLTEDEARARVRAQAPRGDKVAVANWVVDTSGPIEETRRRVAELWDELRRGSRGARRVERKGRAKRRSGRRPMFRW